ncbi:conserved Plasmodium protein, unknown function [Plasmodium ovale wallikeri]|uniref:Uncharacterized protein n=1 Tax=Plasmodium ovale wallikeri TaxID=864142 RepID=A0A1A8YJD2_PLAOA|nr:conserved Plasmodium protein, unknown function [Plasmodium ovale wallikeri]
MLARAPPHVCFAHEKKGTTHMYHSIIKQFYPLSSNLKRLSSRDSGPTSTRRKKKSSRWLICSSSIFKHQKTCEVGKRERSKVLICASEHFRRSFDSSHKQGRNSAFCFLPIRRSLFVLCRSHFPLSMNKFRKQFLLTQKRYLGNTVRGPLPTEVLKEKKKKNYTL